MKKILLIWNAIPENCSIYLLEVDADLFERIVGLHNMYGNSDMEQEDFAWISEFLQTKTCIYNEGESVSTPIRGITVDAVVVCGYFC